MNLEATLSLGLVVVLLALFIWGRWRYDVVAFAGLVVAVVLGLVEPDQAFTGFSHPATVTVAIVLILSRGLSQSGAATYAARQVMKLVKGILSHIALLSGLAGFLSGFMNNVGALALLMPVAIQTAIKAKRPVGRILMPLSFASILGGLVTLIGTPPNIIIASFREEALGSGFSMFDFTPVGGLVAVSGILFIAIVGWRFLPDRSGNSDSANLSDVSEFVSELRLSKGSPAVGKTIEEIENDLAGDIDVLIFGIVHGGKARAAASPRKRVESGDSLIVEARPEELTQFVEKLDLTIAGARDGHAGMPELEDVILTEAVVAPRSRIEGRTVEQLRLRRTYGVNLLAIARQGRPYRGRMREFKFQTGDVLLLQGEAEHLPDVISRLGCLMLAAREVSFGGRRQAATAVGLFAAALVAVVGFNAPIVIALGAAALGMVLFGVMPVREVYDGIDWPVIVLLGALIPVGGALNNSGAAKLIADVMVFGLADLPSWLLILTVLVFTMTLSAVLNNAATAVVMAPIAIDIAADLSVSPDPFLMAVAVGASCAFLTPIGHQNNAMVMGPGGYAFGDYWRLGLPLEILICIVGVPAIMIFWPL